MQGNRRFLSSAAAILASMLFLGCTHVENTRTLVPSEPSVGAIRSHELQRVQFEDIPVPNGFEYVTRGNRSFSYEGGGVRIARFLYWGRQSAEEIVTYFKQTMPLRAYDWDLVSEEPSPDGAVSLSFRKGRQTCGITITPDAGATYVSVMVAGSA